MSETFKVVKLVDPIQFTNVSGGLVPKGAYNPITDYAVGDSVDYNGSSYVMFNDAPAGTLPTNTTYWQVLANKGNVGATGATGATGSVSSTSGITFLPTAAPAYAAGKLVYDSDNESMTFFNNDSMVGLQVGQEDWIRVFNNSGSTIPNGRAVYLNGAASGLPTIALAQANAGSTTIGAGLTTESIPNNSIGYVTCIGVVHGLDTSAFTAGQTVYVSATTPGALVSTAPTAPNYRYRIGIVGVSSATVGTIHVTPSTASLGNGTANQVFGINAAGTAQEVKSITGGSGISVTNAANSISIATDGTQAIGAASSTDNAIARFDGTTGKIIQNSGVIVDDNNIITIPQAGNVTIFNTIDQTTNYERARHYWNGNVYTINTDAGGTGVNRSIAMGSSGVTQFTMNTGIPKVGVQGGTASVGGTSFQVTGTMSATSGVQQPVGIINTINQSGTAGYTGLLMNITETATGSGAKLLLDLQVGGASKMSVDNTGLLTARYSQILDINGNRSATFNATASAVNYINFVNGATTNSVSLRAAGADTSISLGQFVKNLGLFQMRSDTQGFIFTATPVTSGVNYLNVTAAATGNAPFMSTVGSDTNVDMILVTQGTGAIVANRQVRFTAPVASSTTGNVALTTRTELVTTGASVITRTLYTPVGHAGEEVHIQKIDNGAGSVTIATAAGLILGGITSLATQFKRVTYVSDGTNWIVKENN